MSSCFSGTGGRTYGFDLDIVKSSSSWSRATQSQTSSSPSSTISESSNSPPLAISTRKPRTPRKRPNQTYNEAATLLSTAYPNLFSNPNLKTQTNNNNNKFTKKPTPETYDSSELLLPFRVLDTSSSFLLHGPIQHQRPIFPAGPKPVNPNNCHSPGEISSRVNALQLNDDCDDDFDAESILDEEIEEGIDSIMGGRVQEEDSNAACSYHPLIGFGGKFDFRLGLQRSGVRALRHVDEGNWWNLPAVDILQISPKICGAGGKASAPAPAPVTDKKKKKKVVVVEKEKVNVELKGTELPKSKPGLMLKLNYEGVRNAWSDQGKPFADDSPVADVPGNDVAVCFSSAQSNPASIFSFFLFVETLIPLQ